MKRRIIRADAYNWAIQEWQDGGDLIERGRYAGQAKQAKWVNLDKFYPALADAARAMMDDLIGDSVLGEPAITGAQLASMVEVAKQVVTLHVSSLCEAQKTDTLIGILQERGYTVTAGKKGRSSYVEDEESCDTESTGQKT